VEWLNWVLFADVVYIIKCRLTRICLLRLVRTSIILVTLPLGFCDQGMLRLWRRRGASIVVIQ
jgi:hypothetical protein